MNFGLCEGIVLQNIQVPPRDVFGGKFNTDPKSPYVYSITFYLCQGLVKPKYI